MIDRVHLSIVTFCFAVVCPSSVDAYNILVMPAIGKSHVFAMAALADGIAARGHSVTILASSGYKLDRREEEAAGQRGIHYERIDDGIEDYDEMLENVTKTALFDGLRMEDMLPILKEK
jgi:UDP:flavonoid glycosyltransferase YjiC (YdhE family)